MSAGAQTGTITTLVPGRLDRLPWSRFHWRVVVGLGGVWILDGLEVTMVGNVSSRLTEKGSGIELTAAEIGMAAAFYITGACLGALFFGQLTDRFGRRRLFVLTLAVYLIATVATAFAFAPWYFFAARFFTGAGIGGEYAAINSAIDELIPARVRGRVDLVINGSYWLGAAGGAAGALILLDTSMFPTHIGWRLGFGVGVVLGLAVLMVRRDVPESPRWLVIHGHEEEAERIVREIEEEVQRETGQPLPEPEGPPLKIRQRKIISFREIARVAFTLYPRRAILGLALIIGQAFLYNGVTFNLGTLLGGFYGVSSGMVPLFFILWALSNFAGPAGTAFRHGRTKTDDLAVVSRFCRCHCRACGDLRERGRRSLDIHRRSGRVLLPGFVGRERRIPDRQRDLPDGDAGAGDRIFLCGGNGSRWYRGTVALRSDDRFRRPGYGRMVLPHRRGGHGHRRPGGSVVGGFGRAEAA
jgi:MFS family permease